MNLELARPLALVGLALPLIVWLLARRDRGSLEQPTGTLELWREVARDEPARSTGAKTSLALWCALAALAFGVLALAGPRRASAREPATWRIHLDRSPSMFLPHDGASGATRLEVAVARARELLDDARERGDTLEWSESDGTRYASEILPDAWRLAPVLLVPELDWSALDAPGLIVVTDRAPANPPRSAGFAAAGGAEAHGLVACGDRGELIAWNGDGLAHTGQRSALRMRIDSRIQQPIADVARAWAANRGVTIVADGPCELELQDKTFGWGMTSEVLIAGRDGWRVEVGSCAGPTTAGAEPWLSAHDATGKRYDLVVWQPGRIVSTWAFDPGGSLGDPAAWAASWAKLFDDALAPPPGVVALSERLDAGEPSSRAPIRPGGEREDDSTPSAVLAALAALLGCVALALKR